MILIKVVVNCNTLTNRIKLIEHSRNELIYTVYSLLMANHGKSISENFFCKFKIPSGQNSKNKRSLDEFSRNEPVPCLKNLKLTIGLQYSILNVLKGCFDVWSSWLWENNAC